jgi:hypothetical protein
MSKFTEYTLTKQSDELKKLILENPDLPIVVLADEDSVCDYYGWTFCSSIFFHIEEILDCDFYDYDDRIFVDRERFEEKIADDLWDEYHEKSNEEYDAAIKREIEKYEPYWKKVIAIYASN